MVNRIDNLLAAAANWTLDCWRNISTTPERFAQLRLPNVLNYLAYESRNYCWVITQDGVICKADYQIPRWELISKVQNPEMDALKYFITFDLKSLATKEIKFWGRKDHPLCNFSGDHDCCR